MNRDPLVSWKDAAAVGCRPEIITCCLEQIPSLGLTQALKAYRWVAEECNDAEIAYLGRLDRYFLLLVILNQEHMLYHGEKGNRWLYERCREVEANPDWHLDLWAREHYKSTIITFGGAIQQILRNPNVTIAIFAHTRGIAKGFLRQIKREFEENDDLKRYYPDICWEKPDSQAPKWSEDDGLIVKRTQNPKESTLEAWGLVDGQPVSRHYDIRIYDDAVSRESVTTEDQIKKTLEGFELSDNLGKRGGRVWMIGTRYHWGDLYGVVLERDICTARIFPATDDGTKTGNPVFFTVEYWEQKKRAQHSTLSAQMLQKPVADGAQMFVTQQLRSFRVRPRTLNIYILVDPSKGTPNRRSDRTAMAVIAVDAGLNKYLVDGYCHKMKLSQRWEKLKLLYRKWSRMTGVEDVQVGYEQYGMLSDIEHFEEKMISEKITIPIQEVNWTRDHAESKADRMERLQPDIQGGSFFLPLIMNEQGQDIIWEPHPDEQRVVSRPLKGKLAAHKRMADNGYAWRCQYAIVQRDEDGQLYDLTRVFLEQIQRVPYSPKDDLIDASSRIYDVNPMAPVVSSEINAEPTAHPD